MQFYNKFVTFFVKIFGIIFSRARIATLAGGGGI